MRTPQRYLRGELVVVVDVEDLERSAEFWAAALGYVRAGESDVYLSLVPSDGVGIEVLLQKVPDRKRGKNRVHLDLRTADLKAEVARVRALGARLVTEEPVVEAGWVWHVLADPDGNEFCVLQLPSS
ncbi:VOC family protein [Kribbella shirazensis]|jgi:predicted enzyme related to lactoylglutathione lyase|uniref:Putative enzyme related to lactoylglutathione lyase n=1 Tax=Kribbella shirazensis TaxID=1105143 RepID=A0A7X5V5T4_9ACTN|nr:VOC family protein [Kribbella shirazensis]NIK55166.1 putative enzyme related to lactoylglutathione lyase [Kribbella shirazensis]